VGTGLIGTSLALALRRLGVAVALEDRDPAALAVAVQRGAGEAVAPGAPEPGLVVVAVPPAATAAVVAGALARYPAAVVTDVASVKVPVLAALGQAGVAPARYVGGHPMAGREVSGPAGARADLLEDRAWVITPHAGADDAAVQAVQELALAVRALPVLMPADEHDRAVALVSHAPQVLASLLAARLLDSSDTAVSIAGQGLRDMTRIAASDPGLWGEILAANAAPVAEVLRALRGDLDRLLGALAEVAVPGAPGDSAHGDAAQRGAAQRGAGDGDPAQVLVDALRRGNAGRQKVPGKHGARPAATAEVPVVVPDAPGELGRLFAAVAAAGVSVEDVRIEHVLGRPTGVVQLSVAQAAAEPLAGSLQAAGWQVRG
jgi:prephenate dehydrogenase